MYAFTYRDFKIKIFGIALKNRQCATSALFIGNFDFNFRRFDFESQFSLRGQQRVIFIVFKRHFKLILACFCDGYSIIGGYLFAVVRYIQSSLIIGGHDKIDILTAVVYFFVDVVIKFGKFKFFGLDFERTRPYGIVFAAAIKPTKIILIQYCISYRISCCFFWL